jgi:hypothetical protein
MIDKSQAPIRSLRVAPFRRRFRYANVSIIAALVAGSIIALAGFPEPNSSSGFTNFGVTESLPVSCDIKGNIGASGERIFHLPGQRYYSRRLVSPSNGERWFCSEQESRQAGWRKAKV